MVFSILWRPPHCPPGSIPSPQSTYSFASLNPHTQGWEERQGADRKRQERQSYGRQGGKDGATWLFLFLFFFFPQYLDGQLFRREKEGHRRSATLNLPSIDLSSGHQVRTRGGRPASRQSSLCSPHFPAPSLPLGTKEEKGCTAAPYSHLLYLPHRAVNAVFHTHDTEALQHQQALPRDSGPNSVVVCPHPTLRSFRG